MSFDTQNDLNWLAVIVAALAYFVIGALWYAPPVFGKAWMAAGGMTVEPGDGPGPAISLVTTTFESTKPKPMVWGAVNAGYHMVGSIAAGAIIGAWQ